MRRLGRLVLLAGGLALVLGSCVRLPSPRPNNTQHYLLGSALPSDTAADTTGLRLGLRKPHLADYLDTRALVVRRGPHEIHFSNFHRWGEELGPALNRVVALNLEARPGIQSVEVVPWPRGTRFHYVVQLRVLRFEGVGPPPPGTDADEDAPIPNGHSQMVVGWTVFGPEGETLRGRGRTRHRIDGWPVTDYADLVSKLDTSLVVLAEDLSRRLRALPASAP
ncbi:MAG: membrane integrity-associated transporter subunit PqiC [Salinibacter sp.]